MRILITSNSFLTLKGSHHNRILYHDILEAHGPLKKIDLLNILNNIDYLDGYICGDDEIDHEVLDKLKCVGVEVLSKYGVGLDKIDLAYAANIGINIKNCAGINSSTVAEHALSMLLFWAKRYRENVLLKGYIHWNRAISRDINNLRIGLLGLGNIGQEVAKNYKFLGADVYYFDPYVDSSIYKSLGNIENLGEMDVISIHIPLLQETKDLIDTNFLKAYQGDLIINTSRAEIIEENSLLNWLNDNEKNVLMTDVLYTEPPKPSDWYIHHPQIIITPHVSSRSVECIERQANMALDNLGI